MIGPLKLNLMFGIVSCPEAVDLAHGVIDAIKRDYTSETLMNAFSAPNGTYTMTVDIKALVILTSALMAFEEDAMSQKGSKSDPDDLISLINKVINAVEELKRNMHN